MSSPAPAPVPRTAGGPAGGASCLVLEQPGAWRAFCLLFVLAAAVAPTLPLLVQTVAWSGSWTDFLGVGFSGALADSAVVAVVVAGFAFLVGLPAGVLVALYEFPGRRFLLALLCLPLLIPSFLWAVGWSALAARIGAGLPDVLSGRAGCVVVFLAPAIPLVLLATYAAVGGLSGSPVDAARLAGGERTVFRCTCGQAAVPALLGAGLAGVLTLSDPGPGLILGLRTAAAEILTSFAALYDFGLAGRQCVALAGVVLLVMGPAAFLAAPRMAAELSARPVRRLHRVRTAGASRLGAPGLFVIALLAVGAPVLGLTLPLIDKGGWYGRAWTEAVRTAGNTVLFSLGAGFVAVLLAGLTAAAVGRSDRLRVAVLGACLTLVALPPALTALGVIQIATDAPAWTDPLLRSRLTVCAALGVRFFPVAVVLLLRRWATMSSSWSAAAAVHGVPLGRYVRSVVLPWLRPALFVSCVLAALLAAADVGTVLLLHPPGEGSFPLSVFTVMANAPEGLVATMCLFYVGGAGLLLAAGWMPIAGRKS